MLSTNLVFALIAVSQGVFLSFMFFLKKSQWQRLPIALYFACFSLIIMSWILIWGKIYPIGIYFALHIPLHYFLGPLLLVILTNGSIQKKNREFILPLLLLLIFSLYWISKLLSIGIPSEMTPFIVKFHLYAYQCSIISLTIYAIRLAAVKKLVQGTALFITLLCFTGGLIIYEIMSYYGIMTQQIDYVLVGAIFISFYIGAYFLVSRTRNYPAVAEVDHHRLMEICNKIEMYIQESGCYLNKGYRLEELAVGVGEPVSLVSRSIGQIRNTNFKEFINQFRIHHAKKLLLESDLKIEAVAEDSGFSNKVSFISNFKKIIGQNPTEFRKAVNSR